MADDIEDVSFLPGENLNRKSVYEPSVKQRCKQLACSKNRATAIVVFCGLLILIIAIIAAFARSGSSSCEKVNTVLSTPPPNITKEDIYATNGEVFPWQDIRLPDTVEPISYNVFLNPDMKALKFSGTVKIKAKIKATTSLIVLHTKNLTITKVLVKPFTLTGPSTKRSPIIVAKHLEFLKNEQLAILTDRKMFTSARTGIEITIKFNANIVSKLAGFYLSSYKTKSGEIRHIGTTQFQPTGARQAFPCFDEPGLKATFKMSIVRDKKHIALFNMPLNKTEDFKDGRVIDRFQESVKMSTYLVAFVVCDYKSKKGKTKSGVDVAVYAAEDQIDQVDFALKVAITVLEYYDELYKIRYPLPKLDLIAIPDFSAGAMENWGLVTYRESAVLYHPGESSDSDKQWVAVVIAHELAHQWFGNLVTPKWWDDTWLNEGFASYVEYLGTDKVDPTLKMGEQFICKTLQRALSRDSQKTSHPIHVPVHNPDDINEIFDTISYDKGASVIRMLREFLGKEKFMDGITAYLKQYKYGNAVTVDLWSALSKKSGNTVDVKSVMDTWTLQMGYPVVSVKQSGNKFLLTQQRFLSDGSVTTNSDESPFGYKWHIPFRYMVLYEDDTNSTGMVWLHKGSAEISVTKDVKLIKGNYGMYGFYRVNYEEVMWKTIIQQLQTDHTVLSPGDRSGLIDDVFNLARAGLVKHTTALDMTKYLKKEQDYAPWYSALDGLGFIRKILQKSPAYEQFKTYTLTLVKPIQSSLTWNDSGEPLQKYLRSNLLSEVILLGDSDATKKGRQLYDDWMTQNTSIPPNLKTAVYTAGIKYGEWSEWKFMLEKYNNSITPSNKDRYLSTLGETRDSIVINRLLHMALNEDMIKHQDLYKVMRAVTKNPSGQLLAWRFLQQNWEKLLQWYGDVSFTLPEFVKSTTSSFSTEFDYKEVEEFFKKVDSGPAKRAVSTALENIRTNINWLKSHENEVKAWLLKNV
ncbi:endoplasmic reticulum aminopeptidase 1-like [Mytilus californianus]|uniref:endoplasmic reticulum aminopeptidase 1-like n=1 Tax=Mytilus californianus TaxID=6549 RepID=UPI002247C531|nr:endoplasmic reticulum aminopeptidase 1-like [Mytilus californianus]